MSAAGMWPGPFAPGTTPAPVIEAQTEAALAVVAATTDRLGAMDTPPHPLPSPPPSRRTPFAGGQSSRPQASGWRVASVTFLGMGGSRRDPARNATSLPLRIGTEEVLEDCA